MARCSGMRIARPRTEIGGSKPRGLTRTLLEQEPAADFAAVLYALVELGVLERVVPELRPRRFQPAAGAWTTWMSWPNVPGFSPERGWWRMATNFAILGVSRTATSYDIRRAYLELKRELEPVRALHQQNPPNLKEDLDAISRGLDEAYEILRDPTRRDRYRSCPGAPRRVAGRRGLPHPPRSPPSRRGCARGPDPACFPLRRPSPRVKNGRPDRSWVSPARRGDYDGGRLCMSW